MSDGLHGYGSSLLYATAASAFTGATASVTTIGNVTSINNEQTRETIDISTMDSTSRFREFIPGMIDAGEITAEVNYDGAASGTANDLNTAKTNTSTAQFWCIRFNDHTTATSRSSFVCQGYLTNLGFAVPYEDKVTQPLTIKLSGVPTYTDLA